MNVDTTRRVYERAEGRCEYCQLLATMHPAPIQVDHIVAKQHGGPGSRERFVEAVGLFFAPSGQ